MRKLKYFVLGSAVFFLISCSAAVAPLEEDDPPTVFSGPAPAIELISGTSDSCVNTDDTQSTVLGFEVIYYSMGTDVFMVGLMTAPGVGEIGRVEAEGEGRHGVGGWGIYPLAYSLDPNTPITLTITVHAGLDDSARTTSISSLTYNCSTGETISASFTQP